MHIPIQKDLQTAGLQLWDRLYNQVGKKPMMGEEPTITNELTFHRWPLPIIGACVIIIKSKISVGSM